MSIWIGLAMLMAVFTTSAISGVFGMAGGLILLALLLIILPVGTAIAVQGVIQIVANGSRAILSRKFIDWRILGTMMLGLATAGVILWIVRYTPALATVYVAVGLMPILVWIPASWLQLDAAKPVHAFVCGFVGGGLNLTVGVSGPSIDIFFIRTTLDRRTVVATKAAMQVLSHIAKVVFYWQATMVLTSIEWGAVALAAPFAIAGTSAGYWVLQRMNDVNFRVWMRWIVTGIGLYYLVQGILLLI
ncbi:MAG: putative rane transporter protein [Devosia sp.]|uniref:TSUP family transporter n=1 Tax=Devosia sp. TaxID=1871048 RepID=UPI00260A58A1|nr:TSUP family transporter [Devosia sp.]MDB5588035.1 putative rane transporter protein [Devosia sp.]